MASSDIARSIDIPESFSDAFSRLITVEISRDEIVDCLGAPLQFEKNNDADTVDLWAFEYVCGLQLVYQFFPEKLLGFVYADSPEIEHILRHLPLPRTACDPIGNAGLDEELKRLLETFPDRQAEIDGLRAYQVWRQGTDGNPFRVERPTSKRDAECRVRQLDALGHHQHYWCSKVGSR